MFKKSQEKIQDERKINNAVQVEFEKNSGEIESRSNDSHQDEISVHLPQDKSYSIATGRARRDVQKPLKFRDIVAYAFPVISSNSLSFQDAIERKGNRLQVVVQKKRSFIFRRTKKI
ncbi:hypothetical protein AXF42_Ash015772 [Apostasia shenzhenica]|uniref:Uncharacterized protein n=1 Tax=Apostasia shenzhenica TaxID=1088818 RepID=A0A2H9ZXI5_9ASPA|nr:hypothetical protein AXF42_Ash015772 [Apostasia shenzhenica]